MQSNAPLRSAYTKFMDELLQLHHMELVPEDERTATDAYYMPHHTVLEQDGSGKIRVVFNASQNTKSGWSLSDCLFVGPKATGRHLHHLDAMANFQIHLLG